MSKLARDVWKKLIGEIPDGYEVDHIDGNVLNNDISNLRLATHAQNLRNRKKWKNTTSRYKGVYFCPKRKYWVSQIRYQGKTIYIGQFYTELEAHLAWVDRTKELYGEFFNQG